MNSAFKSINLIKTRLVKTDIKNKNYCKTPYFDYKNDKNFTNSENSKLNKSDFLQNIQENTEEIKKCEFPPIKIEISNFLRIFQYILI